MKKAASVTLAVALLMASAPATFANAELHVDSKASVSDKGVKDNGAKGQKGTEHNNGSSESKKPGTTDEETTGNTSSEVNADTNKEISAKVKEAVKTKKQLIELRQQLKKADEITPELKATYEALISSLKDSSDLGQAIEVQKELLQRVYQKGDYSQFVKLGELYKKADSTDLNTFVNGEEPKFDVKPFVEKGRAMVPIRAISAALKADVKWDPTTRTVVITRGDNTITLYLDKKEASVGDKTVTLDATPVIKKGRLFLPLRFVSENLQATVNYQEEGKIIIIDDSSTSTSNPTPSTGTTTGTSTDTTSTSTTDATTSTMDSTSTVSSTSTTTQQ
ncbi:copper amine oxidase N-terminal domain-containing protein [Brevibacillus ginsengisoli]|uniref:copper amine oxidase N-terminal domain-containing protein n=1 Tax=Brevibacillus ginsengisoli TaxID=363854 RepID=UPI003CEA75EC